MARYSLRPQPALNVYDLMLDGRRAGTVYREDDSAVWVLGLNYGFPDRCFPTWSDAPEVLRIAASDEFGTLAALCDAIGVEIGLPATFPALRDAA